MANALAPDASKETQPSSVFLAATLIFTLYLEFFVTRYTSLPARTILDGIVLAAAAMIALNALLRQRLRVLHVILLANIVIFTVFSLFGALGPSLPNSIVSSIIFSKFIIVFFLAGKFELKDLRPVMTMLAVLHLIGCLANLAFPGFFSSLLPTVSYQIDTSRLMGFSLNANRSAAVSTILLLYFSFVDRRIWWAIMMCILIVLSGSRSVTLIAALAFAYIFMQSEGSLSKRAFAVIASIGLGITLVWTVFSVDETLKVIESTIYGDLRYIRAAMLNGGYFLANEFFPFGVGGGLFGSSMSEGSRAYLMVGISRWASVIDMTGVYDSGIGSILGEYGWLGLSVYAVIILTIFRTAYPAPVPLGMAIFLLSLVLFMNLFRTVASDFFFSFFFLFLYALVMEHHQRGRLYGNEKRGAHELAPRAA